MMDDAVHLANGHSLSCVDANYIAGLIDGEGCFMISAENKKRLRRSCIFRMSLRFDDAPILEHVRDLLGGIGTVRHPKPPCWDDKKHPMAVWDIGGKGDCLVLSSLLRQVPLRARKKRDAELWCEALDLWCRVGNGHGVTMETNAPIWAGMEKLRETMVNERMSRSAVRA